MTTTEKIITKRMKKRPIREWWRKNSYIVWRILLFPIWLATLAINKVRVRKYNMTEFSEETAKAFLDSYLPRRCDIYESGALWYNLNWGFVMKKTPRKYRAFVVKFYNKTLHYLVNKYEMQGYVKTIIDTNFCERWLKFEKNA